MVNVIARIKAKGKTYEISVDFEEAMKVKDGNGAVTSALNSNGVYYDVNKGTIASDSDLKDAFGTADIYAVAEQIMKKGDINKPQEFRDAEREKRVVQVIGLVVRNAVDQHGKPYTEDRIKRAADEVGYNFDSKPAEVQMKLLVDKLKTVIPIKIEVKRIKLIIPAQYTGQTYGLIQDFKESENWLSNGDLEVVINIPAGMQLDFYDKLNNVTHGAIVSEELNE